MVTLNARIEENLYHFLEKHGNNQVKRELLLFWGMHPNAKFSRLAICCATDSNKLDVKTALGAMVEEGLLDAHIHNGVTLYSLTTNDEKRRPLLELATLGWNRWHLSSSILDKVAKSQDAA